MTSCLIVASIEVLLAATGLWLALELCLLVPHCPAVVVFNLTSVLCLCLFVLTYCYCFLLVLRDVSIDVIMAMGCYNIWGVSQTTLLAVIPGCYVAHFIPGHPVVWFTAAVRHWSRDVQSWHLCLVMPVSGCGWHVGHISCPIGCYLHFGPNLHPRHNCDTISNIRLLISLPSLPAEAGRIGHACMAV